MLLSRFLIAKTYKQYVLVAVRGHKVLKLIIHYHGLIETTERALVRNNISTDIHISFVLVRSSYFSGGFFYCALVSGTLALDLPTWII